MDEEVNQWYQLSLIWPLRADFQAYQLWVRLVREENRPVVIGLAAAPGQNWRRDGLRRVT